MSQGGWGHGGYGPPPAPGGYGPPPSHGGGYAAPMPMAHAPHGMWTCRSCGYSGHPERVEKVSTAGWIFFLVLTFSCVGLLICWIPLVAMKETTTLCPRCRTPAGTM
jgi:hypothetical protein